MISMLTKRSLRLNHATIQGELRQGRDWIRLVPRKPRRLMPDGISVRFHAPAVRAARMQSAGSRTTHPWGRLRLTGAAFYN